VGKVNEGNHRGPGSSTKQAGNKSRRRFGRQRRPGVHRKGARVSRGSGRFKWASGRVGALAHSAHCERAACSCRARGRNLIQPHSTRARGWATRSAGGRLLVQGSCHSLLWRSFERHNWAAGKGSRRCAMEMRGVVVQADRVGGARAPPNYSWEREIWIGPGVERGRPGVYHTQMRPGRRGTTHGFGPPGRLMIGEGSRRANLETRIDKGRTRAMRTKSRRGTSSPRAA